MRLAAIGIAILLLGLGGAHAEDEQTATRQTCVSNQACVTDHERDTRAHGDCSYGGDEEGRDEVYVHMVTIYVGVPLVLTIWTACHSDTEYVNRHLFVQARHDSNVAYEDAGVHWASNNHHGRSCGVEVYGYGGVMSHLGNRGVGCQTYLEPPMLPSLP